MGNNTQENWWSKGEEDQSENQANAEEFNHESPVIVYNKSPFTASLPSLAACVFVTLILQPVAWGVGFGRWEFYGSMCFNLLFVIIIPLQLMNNKELGERISVDPDKSRIWVSHRGLRTDFKQRRNGSVNYENSDFIRITKRTEEVQYTSGGETHDGWTTFYDILLYRIDGSHKTIFSINGWWIRKMKAVRIGKSIARAAGLDYRKK